MKRSICCLLAVLLLTALAGCGVKEKIAEKAAEEFIEGIGGGQVDIDGDEVIIKGENGEEFTVGSGEWPDSEISREVPKFTKGEITSVLDVGNGFMVTVESVDESDYEAYLEDIKKDFTVDSYETNAEDYRAYGGSTSEGVNVQLTYSGNAVSITVAKDTP